MERYGVTGHTWWSNEVCLAATDEWVIVGRYPYDTDASETAPTSPWSYSTSRTGVTIELGKAVSQNQFALSFSRPHYSRSCPLSNE